MRRIALILAGLVMLGIGWSAVAQSPPLRLYGVVIGAGDQAVAYLQDPGTGRVRGFRIGDSIGDGRVIGIEPDRVVVERGGETVQLRLGGGGPAGSAPQAPPSAPAGRPATPPLCPPFCPAPAPAGAAESSVPEPAESGVAPTLPCPPFCPAPAPGSTEAAPAPLTIGPRPASQLPCPPFCPAKP